MKILQCSLLIPILLQLYGLKIYAAPVEPVNTMEVCWINYPGPGIDGVKDEYYSDMQTTEIFNATHWESADDLSAMFALCFDGDYLYLYAEVKDDTAHNYIYGIGFAGAFDNIELYLQLDTNTVETYYNETTVKLRICRGLDWVETSGRAPHYDFQYYMEDNGAGGWITEVAIPWTAVLPEGSTNADMNDYFQCCGFPVGFDFTATDSDNSDGDEAAGHRDARAAWDMDDPDDPDDRTEGLAWENTSVFGYLTLNDHCGGGDIWPVDGIENTLSKEEPRIDIDQTGEHLRFLNAPFISTVAFYNMQGRRVQTDSYNPGDELDISGLPCGMYVAVLDGVESLRFQVVR